MFIYSVILIASLTATVAIALLYRILSGAGSAVQRSVLSRSKNGPTSHLDNQSVRTVNNDAPPVSWVRHLGAPPASGDLRVQDVPWMLARAHTGKPGVEHESGKDNSYIGPRDKYAAPLQAKLRNQSADCINREDKSEFWGKSYKVTRRVKAREKNSQYVSKPASWA
jgi:hypothetical protein